MSCVVGIDISSVAIDLVRLDENENRAQWERIELAGKSAFDRLLDVSRVMPFPSWWEDVYLVAIEVPESRFRVSLRAQLPIVGAVVASVPLGVRVWDVSPADWKRPLGVKPQEKPTAATFPSFAVPDSWEQDAYDALGVALYARETNARGIAAALTTVDSERKAA